jgi:oligopeptide transport system substrate-binding protein
LSATFFFYLVLFTALLTGCSDAPWNNPYPAEQKGNVLFTSFSERPKHLDPARAYSSDEYAILGQIYEPPLQYHYLKRPYQLEPLTAEQMPQVHFFDANDQEVDQFSGKIAYSEYLISIRKGIHYQPHPAFVIDENGQQAYIGLSAEDVEDIHELSDFQRTGSRELTAEDYVYQIKRLAHPDVHSPILGLMSEYIDGLGELAEELKKVRKSQGAKSWLDLRLFDLVGAQVVDRYRYRIRIKGLYPQIRYWLSMPFFAAMPWEVERFYQQPLLIDKNITLDWYPVGTGAYYLAVNNPNKQMVLQRNPSFRHLAYPCEGMPEDKVNGMLEDCARTMPFIDRVVRSLEKESIPYWNKFLQGYYDTSGISSDSFDQAIQIGSAGEIGLTDDMRDKGIRLLTEVSPSIYYFGFNMLDDIVGGFDDRAKKLRRAIAIAVDYEEYISIFLNGRGVAGQGPIPPGIFGHQEGEKGVNPQVYRVLDGKVQRRPISEAMQLLAEAGYPNGIDPKTGQALVLNLDTTGGGPDSKANLAWWRKQFDKLNIQLVIRNTDYNRFRDKMEKGTAQMFQWGWNADYPDPENFLFLLYGPNSKAKSKGENASNYSNPEFDKLFMQMKNMSDGPQRMAIIEQMTTILRQDSPWLWGVYPKSFGLYHAWYFNAKPNAMAHNTLMYKRIDHALREQKRTQWNQPVWWPMLVLLALLLFSLIPAWRTWKRSESESQMKRPQGVKD